jgi:hypothetical protein
MNRLVAPLVAWLRTGWEGWNRFWFTPQDAATLGLIRILAGAMLFYTHLVWAKDFSAFFGPNPWVELDTLARLQADGYAWSHFWLIRSPGVLWILHLLALGVFALLTVGLYSRPMAVLSLLITLSYIHRLSGSLYGLDQCNAMLAMYLAVGPCGEAYSLDRWLAARREGLRLPAAPPRINTNVAVRLLQLHMCIIYLFAGMSKLQGPAWWDGTAMWGAVAIQEYQSIDMTWLARHPVLVAIATHTVLFWELFYAALIWPRFTRPVMLLLAIPLHLGIALFLGMPTFGLAMLMGNLAFVPPEWVRAVLGPRPAGPATHSGQAVLRPTRRGNAGGSSNALRAATAE